MNLPPVFVKPAPPSVFSQIWIKEAMEEGFIVKYGDFLKINELLLSSKIITNTSGFSELRSAFQDKLFDIKEFEQLLKSKHVSDNTISMFKSLIDKQPTETKTGPAESDCNVGYYFSKSFGNKKNDLLRIFTDIVNTNFTSQLKPINILDMKNREVAIFHCLPLNMMTGGGSYVSFIIYYLFYLTYLITFIT